MGGIPQPPTCIKDEVRNTPSGGIGISRRKLDDGYSQSWQRQFKFVAQQAQQRIDGLGQRVPYEVRRLTPNKMKEEMLYSSL